MKAFFRTDDGWTGLVLRVALGGVMLPHGAQKLLGWFGGPGFSGTMEIFTGTLGLPWILAFLVVLAESFGALGLILGFLTRLDAFGILCVMAGAVAMAHWPNGFFMDWFGQQAGEGFEYHLLAMGLALGLLIGGGGRHSVDGAIARRI
ncbi:MAG: DoxX family protein [Acidobacteria bacterium]|nr:DoxX family protein [Acidobacteriota bacterium]